MNNSNTICPPGINRINISTVNKFQSNANDSIPRAIGHEFRPPTRNCRREARGNSGLIRITCSETSKLQLEPN